MQTDPIPALKASLGEELARALRSYDLWDVAVRAGTHRSELSRIRSGCLERVSLERLIRILARVRRRVEVRIVVEPFARQRHREAREAASSPSSHRLERGAGAPSDAKVW